MASSGPTKAPTVSSDWRRPKAAPRMLRRRDVGHQRIARRAADALADAVDEARGDDGADAAGQREQGLVKRAHRVAQHGQPLAPAEVVAERAGEDLRDQRRRLGDALDQADRQHADAQRADQEQRQQAVDHLRRDVHQQADEAEHPDAAGSRGWSRGAVTPRAPAAPAPRAPPASAPPPRRRPARGGSRCASSARQGAEAQPHQALAAEQQPPAAAPGATAPPACRRATGWARSGAAASVAK